MTMMSAVELGGAVEISEDREWTSIALAGYTGEQLRVELIDYLPRRGGDVTAAAVARVEQLTGKYDMGGWAIDPASPAATLLLPLGARGVPIVQPNAREVAAATATFLDLCREERVKAARNRALRESVRDAETRRLAGGMAFDRRLAEVGPMLSCALAVWAATVGAGLGPDDVYVGGCQPDPAPIGAGDLSAVLNWPGMRQPPPLPPLPLP